jgi:guanylate kinase
MEHVLMARGRLFVLSGPSGAGKTALGRELRALERDLYYVVTATTRKPRPGEQDGVDYLFFTEEDFQDLSALGAFVEYARVPPTNGYLYGTPKTQLTEPLERGEDVYAQVDVQGAHSIKAIVTDAILICRRTSRRCAGG